MFLHAVLYISVSNGFFPSYLVIDLHACFFVFPYKLELFGCLTYPVFLEWFFFLYYFFFIVGLYFLRLYIVLARVFFSWQFGNTGCPQRCTLLPPLFFFFRFLAQSCESPPDLGFFPFMFFLLSIERETGTGGRRVAGEVSPLRSCVDALRLCWVQLKKKKTRLCFGFLTVTLAQILLLSVRVAQLG